MHLEPNPRLEVLVTCSLSVEIDSVIRQHSVVAGLRCYHRTGGLWLSSQVFACTLGLGSQNCSDQDKLAEVSCRRVTCPLLNCFYY
jgi:hypothetical protein